EWIVFVVLMHNDSKGTSERPKKFKITILHINKPHECPNPHPCGFYFSSNLTPRPLFLLHSSQRHFAVPRTKWLRIFPLYDGYHSHISLVLQKLKCLTNSRNKVYYK